MSHLKERGNDDRHLNRHDLMGVGGGPGEHLGEEKRMSVFAKGQNGSHGLEERNNRGLKGSHGISVTRFTVLFPITFRKSARCGRKSRKRPIVLIANFGQYVVAIRTETETGSK